jgi:branched-chain amino acid aminotransferase
MPMKIWIDGRLFDKDDAKISVFDHGLLYGDGVFEGIRIYNGRIFECEAHLRRLYDSARSIRLEIPQSPAQFRAALEQTVAGNELKDGYIRAIVTRGGGDLGIDPRKCAKPTVIIIAGGITIYPSESYAKGIDLITASVIRNHPNALCSRIKSLNYLNNILARIEANDAGAAEAIMLNHVGNVAECTADNVFIVRGGEVQTPTTADGILEGVTRRVVLGLCAELNIPAVEKTLQRYDLYVADECFLSGTAAEVIPATRIDRRPIGDGTVGPITRRLIEAFGRHVRSAGSDATG